MRKQTKINQKANRKLKELYQEKGIDYCEICGSRFGLTFAHRHKRVWYYRKPELLWDFNQTLVLCLKCHMILEKSRPLTKHYFNILRDENILP